MIPVPQYALRQAPFEDTGCGVRRWIPENPLRPANGVIDVLVGCWYLAHHQQQIAHA